MATYTDSWYRPGADDSKLVGFWDVHSDLSQFEFLC